MAPLDKFDYLIVGGGAAGCVLANRLSADADVCLLEAGPDYGPHDSGAWPQELLDARDLPFTHAWERSLDDSPPHRGRMIGGASGHNNCFATWGLPADYDAWAAHAPGWDWATLEPYIAQVVADIRMRRVTAEEEGVFARAFGQTLVSEGRAQWGDFNDFREPQAVDFVPVNRVGDLRFQAAFAYLDPIRARDSLTIIDQTVVARILLEGERAIGVEAVRNGQPLIVHADKVVISAGAYGSPLVLLRSGIGAAAELEAYGIAQTLELAAVGQGLLDHPGTSLVVVPTAALVDATAGQYRAGKLTVSQLLARVASSSCAPASWDLHLAPLAAHIGPKESEEFLFKVNCYAMRTVSRGSIRLSGPDPEDPPHLDPCYLMDLGRTDLNCLADALAMARDALLSSEMSHLVQGLAPGTDDDLERFAARTTGTGHHLAGTCRMGSAGEAVVDAQGRVHGLENVYVADASVMPELPAANTHVTTLALAARLADLWTGIRRPLVTTQPES